MGANESFESEHLNIVNCSLQMSIFPSAFKTAVVRPLLKMNNLNPDILNNYRPVSNFSFLSKILEKLVFNTLNYFLMKNNVSEKFHSAFRVNLSTETAL